MEDDGDDKDDSKRRTRNLSEKKRRDQFNLLVNELSAMVSTNNRKMDKSTVLKSTISFLKNHNEITVRSRAHDVQEDWKPAFLSNEEFTYLVLEALEGFVMVLSSTGRIYYVSESITSLLGHNPSYLVNKSIFDLTYEEDRPNLYDILQRNVESDSIHSASKDSEMVRFEIHLQRGSLDFGLETSYELVTFNGHFRTNLEQLDGSHDTSHPHDLDTRSLFVCTGRLHTPQLIRDVSLIDSSRNEFTSRHSLEWKFLFLDHRAPPIIGYLPFEVLGTSGYDYYHFDDLEKVVTCHEALMEKGELTSCYYRFLTKGQQWIWLQTRFYITYHQWNSKPEFVVCTHRVVSNADIAKSTKEEGVEGDSVSEGEVNRGDMKETPEDSTMVSMSPAYMSEASDAFASSYQTHSQADASQRSIKDAPSDDATMAPMSPSYMSEASDVYATSYRSHSQAESMRRMMRDSDDAAMASMSPTYMSEPSEAYGNSHRTHSRAASVKTASAGSTGGRGSSAAWVRAARHRYGSDSGSLSGESCASSRHRPREKKQHQLACYEHCNVVMFPQGHKGPEQTLAPQHGIGAQFLDPAPYMGAVGVPGVLPLPPLPPLPVIVSQDQAQMQWPWQEQLQRKHEELQEMIERQQEELRQVKEQLLLARLGIMQPLINVPYVNPEELHQQQGAPGRAQITYPAPHPPHPPGPHHHLPQ